MHSHSVQHRGSKPARADRPLSSGELDLPGICLAPPAGPAITGAYVDYPKPGSRPDPKVQGKVRYRPTGSVTPSLGFGQVKRASPEVIQIGVRTPGGWLKIESSLGGAENLFEQLGAALGHVLSPGGRLRLKELENLLADAKNDRLRLLALQRELTQARSDLGNFHAVAAVEPDAADTSSAKTPSEKIRPFFEKWQASGKFLRPFLADHGHLANYQMWMQRFRFRMREEYQAHLESLLSTRNRNGCPRRKAA